MATLIQLESQIQKLQRRADQLRERKSVEIIANIHALMQEHGLTVADLSKGAVGKRRGRPVGSKNAAKGAGTSTKSKLPAKYRDPVSGMTWSGHARPPAWIKDAPDRSVFLINGAAGGASASKKSAGQGRPATKRVAKRAGRTPAKKAASKRAQNAGA